MEIKQGSFYFINDTLLVKVVTADNKKIIGYDILSDSEQIVAISQRKIKKIFPMSPSIFKLMGSEKAKYLLARDTGFNKDVQANLLSISLRSFMRLRMKYDYKQDDDIHVGKYERTLRY